MKRATIHSPLYDLLTPIRQRVQLRKWERSGKLNNPPHLIKQLTVKQYARAFALGTFVETGTYLGDMVDAVKDIFDRLYSIELDPALYERAKKRFSRFEHIAIIHGDSAEVLPGVLANLATPCVFWFDAHFSGGITSRGKLESPVFDEVRCTISDGVEGHVILIDDAGDLGRSGYPTLPELRHLILTARPNWLVEVKDDIVRAHKR